MQRWFHPTCAVLPAELIAPVEAYAAERGVPLREPTQERRSAVSFAFPRVKRPQTGARGSRLFHASRKRVYRARTANEAIIRAIVDLVAISIGSPATASDRAQIARSIARFMRERWIGPLDGGANVLGTRDINDGVMTREAAAEARLGTWKALDVSEQRAEAGRRSARLSRSRKDAAIEAALAALAREGVVPTQAAVAARCVGVSLRTVQRRWKTINARRLVSPNGPNPSGCEPWKVPLRSRSRQREPRCAARAS